MNKEYWIIVRQGGGCDYTIGCGVCVGRINAKTYEDAVEYAIEEYALGYQEHGQHDPDVVEVLEVTKYTNMHDALIVHQTNKKEQIAREKAKKIKKAEKEEYERLKEKYG
jgi:hypothetical protein